MKVKAVFLTALALSSVVIVGIVVYIKETVQDVIRFSESTDFYSPNHFFAYNSKLHDYTAQRRTTQKPFIYLTETDHCLPRNLASSSQIGDPETCNCDVIVLSFRAKCKDNNQSHITYLFDSNTLFASGRNELFFAALDRRPGYHYYIFIDDDITLRYNEFTPANMTKMSPFRAVEKWLLDYEPAVGVLDYKVHHGASIVLNRRRDLCGISEPSLVLPTVFFDAIFNAFHHKAVEHVLPYPTKYERGCIFASNRDTMIAVEVKFGGQALLFAPVAAGNPKHREYDRSEINMTEISREFIARIKQEAPPMIRNHVIFKMLQASPKLYLETKSPSFCVNVTRHQPIIPYRHLLNDV
ncbi:uncharacterized protein LOC110043463 [Orbicella faveolata]|uniref:uncharacterized protein LOC110043463 n=1 Tax=Orbicella faveolata TaxID=48498 RepID=UPI0009E2CD87|nr:uncharacterized protein LOC110043463 [Orbicella faveolata]